MNTQAKVLLVASLVVLNAVPAFAQRSDAPARFPFAGQVYELEHVRMPKHHAPLVNHNVVPGQVNSPSGLGLDPSMLMQPVARAPINPATFGAPRVLAPLNTVAVSVPQQIAPRSVPSLAERKVTKQVSAICSSKPKAASPTAHHHLDRPLPPVMTYGEQSAYEPASVVAERDTTQTHVRAVLVKTQKP